MNEHPMVEMNFAKDSIGWYWDAKVGVGWRDKRERGGWAPTLRVAKFLAARAAQKMLQPPKVLTFYFDEAGNPMDYRAGGL